MSQVYNFSAGPAMLPKQVLQVMQDELPSYLCKYSHHNNAEPQQSPSLTNAQYGRNLLFSGINKFSPLLYQAFSSCKIMID
jgi:hypothetical protein